MRFGLFDHVERSAQLLADELDDRLAFVAAADAAGFFCYHVAEHHGTPLNLTPSPGVYLGAVARSTSRIRLGPLVYLLPFYQPLRIIEEICLLDHLSRGRLQVGVGRGVSPFERGFENVSEDESRDRFIDAFRCVTTGLTHETLDYGGPYYMYRNTPMALQPLQRPYPPFWYGSSNAVGAAWAGEHGMHFVANGSTAHAGGNIEAYRSALRARGAPEIALEGFPGGTAIGTLRYVIVAESDAEAERVARPAFEHHAANLNYLRLRFSPNQQTMRLDLHQGITYESAVAAGVMVAGAPETVVAAIAEQTAALGTNYLLAYLFFGTMTAADAHRSLDLFASEVMPKLAPLGADPFGAVPTVRG